MDDLLHQLAEIRITLQATRGYEDAYEDAVVLLCDVVKELAAKVKALESRLDQRESYEAEMREQGGT